MKARLTVLWLSLTESFWFLPALITLGAVGLAVGAVNLDERFDVAALRGLGWVYTGSADGARSMLAAIAGAALGVAGTVFSITIAALVLASGQMGPRLLDRFTRDRGNQGALGVFLATFAYALLVLRTVRSGEATSFVPHLAVTLGLALALLSLAVLIYFIHHIAQGINVGQVIRLVADDLEHAVEKHFPQRPPPQAPVLRSAEQAAPVSGWEEPSLLTEALLAGAVEAPAVDGVPPSEHVLRAAQKGYVQVIDLGGLVRIAQAQGGLIRLRVRPGDFVFPGMVVAQLSAPFLRGLPGEIVLGPRRTSRQDVEFAARQLSEIAVRSLSPAINDPFSAVACLDYLGAALCRTVGRDPPPSRHFLDGALRLTLPVTDYGGLTDVMFHQIRQNGANHPSVLIRLLEVLTVVAGLERRPARLAELERHADLVMQTQAQATWVTADRRDLEARYRHFHRVRRGPDPNSG